MPMLDKKSIFSWTRSAGRLISGYAPLPRVVQRLRSNAPAATSARMPASYELSYVNSPNSALLAQCRNILLPSSPEPDRHAFCARQCAESRRRLWECGSVDEAAAAAAATTTCSSCIDKGKHDALLHFCHGANCAAAHEGRASLPFRRARSFKKLLLWQQPSHWWEGSCQA